MAATKPSVRVPLPICAVSSAMRSSHTCGVTFVVDAVVGDHLGVALGVGHIDEHAGTPLCGVEVLHEELLDGALMGAGALERRRRDGDAHRLPLHEQRAGGKDGELRRYRYTRPATW